MLVFHSKSFPRSNPPQASCGFSMVLWSKRKNTSPLSISLFKSPFFLLQSFHSLSFQTNQAHDWDQIGSSRFVWFECVSRNLLPNTTPCLLRVPMFEDLPNRLFSLHVQSETLRYWEFLRVLGDVTRRSGLGESIQRQWERLGARPSGWNRWPKQRSLMAAYHRMESGTTCWYT